MPLAGQATPPLLDHWGPANRPVGLPPRPKYKSGGQAGAPPNPSAPRRRSLPASPHLRSKSGSGARGSAPFPSAVPQPAAPPLLTDAAPPPSPPHGRSDELSQQQWRLARISVSPRARREARRRRELSRPHLILFRLRIGNREYNIQRWSDFALVDLLVRR